MTRVFRYEDHSKGESRLLFRPETPPAENSERLLTFAEQLDSNQTFFESDKAKFVVHEFEDTGRSLLTSHTASKLSFKHLHPGTFRHMQELKGLQHLAELHN
jgi:hypothetical protein